MPVAAVDTAIELDLAAENLVPLHEKAPAITWRCTIISTERERRQNVLALC